MKKTILAVIVTALVIYIWGFLYWGVSTLPYSSWRQAADDTLAQEILAEHFPESGAYFVPGFDHEQEALDTLYARGPTAFVHIRHGESSQVEPARMVAGLALNLAFVALLAAFFRIAGAKEFRDFARLSTVAGLAAVILTNVGDMIWWRISVEWKVWQLVYDYSLWLIAGHLLGIFMKKPAAGETA